MASQNLNLVARRCPAAPLLLLALALLTGACDASALASEPTRTATQPPAPVVVYSTITPSLTPTLTPTPTHTPVTPSATPTPTPTYTPFPTKDPAASMTPVPLLAPLTTLPEPHFWLGRPIPEDFQNTLDANYRYATTQGGKYRPHHGIEFPNPSGVPVIAAGPGEVVFAGPDWEQVLGPNAYFYGNVVVVKLAQPYLHQPLYTLYGHLSEVDVVPGQAVQQGQLLGLVGGTGVALGGTHLHFEVRVGYNDYHSTRNPELWLRPFPRWGTLAGRVTDSRGQLVPIANITIRSVELDNDNDEPVSRFTVTYAAGTSNPDDELGENFVVMDLPPGLYSVGVNTGRTTRTRQVRIPPNGLGWIELTDIIAPATWTPTPTATP